MWCWWTCFIFWYLSGVNSGVMLMNLTRLRKSQWLDSLMEYYKEYRLRITWGDQDLINIYFHFHPGKYLSDRERFLLNGPMALPQNFNGPYLKPNGPFFTCIFRFWKLCNRLSLYFSCQLSYTLYKTFYFHLSKARAKVIPKPVYIYGVRTFHFRFQ